MKTLYTLSLCAALTLLTGCAGTASQRAQSQQQNQHHRVEDICHQYNDSVSTAAYDNCVRTYHQQ